MFKKLKSLNILLVGFENKTIKVTVVVIGFTQVFHPTKTTSMTLKQCDKPYLQEIYFINWNVCETFEKWFAGNWRIAQPTES